MAENCLFGCGYGGCGLSGNIVRGVDVFFKFVLVVV